MPAPDVVVVIPAASVYPVPPDSVVASNVDTTSFGLALTTVIVALFVTANPPRLVPTMVIVSLLRYPVPGLDSVVEYVAPFLLMSNIAPTPVPLVADCDNPLYVCEVPLIGKVRPELNVRSLPTTLVTNTAIPSPRSKTNPALMPVVSVTVIVVSPAIALVIKVVVAAVPPGPLTAVI